MYRSLDKYCMISFTKSTFLSSDCNIHVINSMSHHKIWIGFSKKVIYNSPFTAYWLAAIQPQSNYVSDNDDIKPKVIG